MALPYGAPEEFIIKSEGVTYRKLAGKESLAEGGKLVKGENDIYAALGRAYAPVTSEISGLNAGGRYSKVPQTYQYLLGMDYPFPTVLTQTRALDGRVFNVHYGEWPLNGIVRENGGKPVDMDMFVGLTDVSASGETQTADWQPGHYEETLTLTEDVVGGGTWSVTSSREDIVTATFWDADENNVFNDLDKSATLIITAHAARSVPVFVTVTYTDRDGIPYTTVPPITVNVTANTQLKPDSARIFPNDVVTVPLETYGTQPGEKLYVVPLTGKLDIHKDGLTITEDGNLVESAPFAWNMTEVDDTLTLRRENEGTAGAKFAVNVPYDYTQPPTDDGYKAEDRADNIAVELAALPASLWEKVKTDGGTGETEQWTWTIDFSEEYAPSAFAVTAPVDPVGYTVTVDDSGKITLTVTDENRFPEDGVELTVALTMDEYEFKLDHTLTVTVPKFGTEELKPAVRWSNEVPGIWTVDFSAYEPDRIEVAAPENAGVSEDGRSIIIPRNERSTYPEDVSLTVIVTRGELRQLYELTVTIPAVLWVQWDENGNIDIDWEDAEINAVKVWTKEGDNGFIEAASWISAETADLEDDGSKDVPPEDGW